MKKMLFLICLGLVCLWQSKADALLIDPYDNALPPDGFYGLVYGNYYHAASFTGPGGKKAADADLTAAVSLVRLLGYRHVGGLPLAFQVIAPFGQVEEKKLFNEKSSGAGDLVFGPGIFLYSDEASKLNLSYWLYFFAPTGDWDKSRTINLGQNHWYFEHQLALNKQFGSFVYDMNLNYYQHTEESDNKLQKADRFELETSLGYQLTDKLVVGINAGGYADLGSAKVNGVAVADSKAERWQLGPSIGYSITDRLGANLRWTNDVSATNDSKGNDVFLRINYAF